MRSPNYRALGGRRLKMEWVAWRRSRESAPDKNRTCARGLGSFVPTNPLAGEWVSLGTRAPASAPVEAVEHTLREDSKQQSSAAMMGLRLLVTRYATLTCGSASVSIDTRERRTSRARPRRGSRCADVLRGSTT